jgi:hypothetical protein
MPIRLLSTCGDVSAECFTSSAFSPSQPVYSRPRRRHPTPSCSARLTASCGVTPGRRAVMGSNKYRYKVSIRRKLGALSSTTWEPFLLGRLLAPTLIKNDPPRGARRSHGESSIDLPRPADSGAHCADQREPQRRFPAVATRTVRAHPRARRPLSTSVLRQAGGAIRRRGE